MTGEIRGRRTEYIVEWHQRPGDEASTGGRTGANCKVVTFLDQID